MPDRTVITIGNFDGVHLGHRAILRNARALADENHATLLALSFDPHPATRLHPDTVPPRLTTRAQRETALRHAGADHVIFLTPDRATLDLEPEAFIRQLIDDHHPVAFVEGPDFRFGHNRRGDLDMLRDLGRQHDFQVHITQPVGVTLHDRWQHTASSSLARWLIGRGRVEDATLVLGRPFALQSTVTRGEQRGRTIGFPTINLHPQPIADMILPADGVYAGTACLRKREHPAAISVGTKPSFDADALTVEAHLLDFDQDVYDQPVTLEFTRWLRDQARFPDLDALTDQLARDVEQVRTHADKGRLAPTARAMAPIISRL
ncbi:riboflavin biosynthesis protein RibF [Mucisphaera calidilacus]|uniref:Riboflavin biosynthesis protein n=1 Tax=Mucisphaera calidilacus TaxID=2527982 RepID=A0A518BUZ9_9BACT|nr:riboflavin biosynthesis protein RibF [Mucisphaera calidilacus]QDU70815.1 Riboflavin kinase [Mucisphaera calidilacus]